MNEDDIKKPPPGMEGFKLLVSVVVSPPVEIDDGPAIGTQWPVSEVLREAREGTLVGEWQQLGDDDYATRIK